MIQAIKSRMSPITRRRWNSFFRQKRAWVGLVLFLVIFFFSMTAELWSNSKPIVMKREGKWFFPSMVNYAAVTFGETETFVVDFRALSQKDKDENKGSFYLFPLNRFDPYEQSAELLSAPSNLHWLGTDSLGRDVTARLIYGIRVSLLYGLMFWMFTFTIGIVLGSLQGFFGGEVDFFMERGKELIDILPFLSVVILINGLMNADSFWITLGIVVILSWTGVSSQMRAQVLSLRRREFCEAARACGSSNSRIIFKHILPNSLTPILTLTPFTISVGITTLSTLDYLGFGLNPPTPSIGELLQQGRAYILNAPWLLTEPAIMITVLLISINLIGESLREAFDPRK